MPNLLDHLEILANPYKSDCYEPLAVDEFLEKTTRYTDQRLNGQIWDENEWVK